MKIERAKLKKSNSELPEACKPLRDSLVAAKDDKSMYDILKNVKSWEYGKSELFHWVDVLDRFDSVMERSCERVDGNKWMLACDQPENSELKLLMLQVMRFTSMLIEYSFQRHSYESMDHLVSLLSSSDMDVVLEVLNVLYVFSKRSNFMGRLSAAKKSEIVVRLQYLAESWGGKENGFGLAECCQDLEASRYPPSATTVHFEFYINRAGKTQPSNLCTIHLERVDQMHSSPSQVMTEVLAEHEVPEAKQMLLFTHIRLAHSFSNFKQRSNCILARLQAISVLVYSHAGDNDVAHQIIYNGFITELVNVLELNHNSLIDMKAAVLRTLTAIIHLERNPKLEAIIDVTGANTYHGFLPSLVRKCIVQMVDPAKTAYPHPFSTALFSFLYHLASYESGGEALLSCGIMPSLLQLVSWHSDEQEHITFVTRAVRIIDLMTNMCTQSFESHSGLKVFIERLEHEVKLCREEQPYVIRPSKYTSLVSIDNAAMDVSESSQSAGQSTSEQEGQPRAEETTTTESTESSSSMSTPSGAGQLDTQLDTAASTNRVIVFPVLKTGAQCLPQRSALLKSILNFFKKVIPEPTLSLSESIRHIMEGSLPKALQHIISNAEYYGASLFLLALDVVTVFVFQEPSMLSPLQDKGLTEVVLESLLCKDVPTTREVLAALPNVFSALCLNQRGLDAFVQYKPFDKLFKVLLTQEYLPAMRKRKSSDTFGDTASNLGTAMDELMRHQPSLRVPAIEAIIGLLKELIRMGTDTSFICTTKGSEPVDPVTTATTSATQGSSDIESEDDDEVTEGQLEGIGTQPTIVVQEETMASGESTTAAAATAAAPVTEEVKPVAPRPVPLVDYILNVMKFVEAIMGNTTADDHCTEFITQGGLEPLFTILKLPNLPVDFPSSQACQSVSIVFTVLLKLSHEPRVLEEGLKQLTLCLNDVEKLYEPLPPPGGSVLLAELASAVGDNTTVTDAINSPCATPLLHSLTAMQAYIKVFVHMCRLGQAELRHISLTLWSTDRGLAALSQLGKLYFTLVWEGTVLLAVCSDNDMLPADSEFARADLAKLLPKCSTPQDMDTDSNSSVGVTAAMEGLSTIDMAAAASAADEDAAESGAGEASTSSSGNKKLAAQLAAQAKQIRPLLNVSSRLGSTLADLFQNVLVKLCVGSLMYRQRRPHQPQTNLPVPSANARTIVKGLSKMVMSGLKWSPPTEADLPRLRSSFLMCAVGFTLPMLFEDSTRSYHLMLQEFTNIKGHDAFFDVFDDMVEQLPCPVPLRGSAPGPPTSLPDHAIEFLDTWLLLAEKLVHPKHILDSMYALPEKGNTSDYVKFSPTDYLKSMLKPVFNCVLKLWNHPALVSSQDMEGTRLAQLEQIAIAVLTILCHIINAEKTIKEKENGAKDLSKSKGTNASTSGASSAAGTSGGSSQSASTRPGLAPLSEDNALLRDLMDMGFSRERCVEALNFTSTVEQATEYLITHMIAGTAAGGHPPESAMDMSLSEDEQIRAAIELSLTGVGDDAESTPDKPASTEVMTTPTYKVREGVLTSSDLDEMTDQLVPGCMALLDNLPNTVFKICQLMVIAFKRNGDSWREEMFKQLFLQIRDACTLLTEDAVRSAWGSTKESSTQYFKNGEKNLKLASRMHLFTLLIQEVDAPCISILQDNGFIHSVLELIGHCMPGLRLAGTAGTPQWLAPMMLIIDQCEKAAVAARRKADAKSVLGSSTVWKWFDDRNGRWCAYNGTSNNVIDAAYKAGETSVRFSAGRRKYLVQFNAMLQLNEETGNRRPVMLCAPKKEERGEGLPMDTSGSSMESLLPDQIRTLIRCCVDLISVPVECETLHAVLRLCLRCTRLHDMADVFVNCGGVDQLLALSQSSAFSGFTSLCTLIIRHILEDQETLKYSMGQVIKEVALGVGSTLCGVSPSSMGNKEVHYVMRQLGPAMCRNSELLKTLAKSNMKISLPYGKEPPWSTQHQVDIVGPVADKSSTPDKFLPTNTFRKIITSLLNILIVPYDREDLDGTNGGQGTSDEVTPTPEVKASTSQPVTAHRSVLEGLLATSNSTIIADGKVGESLKLAKEGKLLKDGDSSASKPLLSKSAILRMLAEFTRSYPSCVNLIVQHMYMAGQSDLVTETCTALTFLFDKLLPLNQECGDRDCPALSKILLASIASCNHAPEGQVSVVNELRASLQRTLAMPEVNHKYTHIQSLTGLVSTLVDACPSSSGQLKSPLLKSMGQQTMNQMVKLMVKRGLVSDLARIPHSLDLSNPTSVTTINALLKPLETLSRIVNQPQITQSGSSGKSTSGGEATSTANDDPPATTTNNEDDNSAAGRAAAAEGDNVASADHPVTNAPSDDAAELAATALNNMVASELDTGEEADMSYGVDDLESLEHLQRETVRPGRLINDVQQVHEVLEQALDDILSQGQSDHSREDMDRVNDVSNMSDMEDVDRADEDDDRPEDDEDATYHEDEEDDTTDDDDEEEEDDEDDDDDDDGDEAGNNGANAGAGELGIDEEEWWSEEEEMGGAGGLANILALDDDDDLFSRLEAYDPMSIDHGLGRPRILVADPGSEGFRTLQVPMCNVDMDNANDEAGVAIPPAPNAVPITHPLMNPSAAVSADVNRSHHRFMPGLTRTRRPAGNARAIDRLTTDRMNYGLPMMSNTSSNTFFHRLFGNGVAANILQLTTRLGAGGATRLYISDEDQLRGAGGRQDEDYNDFFQDGMEMVKNMSGPGILNNIPSTLYRWIEECRVLDGASVHDVIMAIKPSIVDSLMEEKKALIDHYKKVKEEKEAPKSSDSSKESSASSVNMSALSALRREQASANTSVRNLRTELQALGSALADSSRGLDAALLGNQEQSSRPNSSSTTRNPELLSSIHALLGGDDELANDVARLCARREELRARMSAHRARPDDSEAEVGTSAQPDASSEARQMAEALRDEMSEANVAAEGTAEEPQAATANNVATTSDAAQDAQQNDASDAWSLPSSLPDLLATEVLPEQATGDSSPEEITETVTPAAESSVSAEHSSQVDQDRACTPPNIFYDGDEPVTPPQADDADDPLPSAATDSPVVVVTTVPTSLLLEIPLQSASSLAAAPSTVTSVNPTPHTSRAADNVNGSQEQPGDIFAAPTAPPASTDPAPADSAANSSTANNDATSLPSGLEGVDPSFLEALPESIRREVIAEQLRLARVQNQLRENMTTPTTTPSTTAGTSSQSAAPSTSTAGASAGASTGAGSLADVSAEFLAALPPAIQEEVLAVQRAEQARQAASVPGAESSQDPGSFLNSLPASLRQQVLADMDDSQISVLPADLMAEAHLLRGELEDRNRRLHNHMFPGSSSLGSILRQTALGSRGINQLSSSRFLRRGAGGLPWPSSNSGARSQSKTGGLVRRGRQLLDQEGLACLLVLLFLDEPRLNINRLHRIFKNLGYHNETLLWIVRALISILMRSNQSKDGSSEGSQSTGKQSSQSSWLSFGMDAALGCRANVFQVQHNSSKRTIAGASGGGTVNIHPQAAQLVCQHVMDTLIYLSKAFTVHFLPTYSSDDEKTKSSSSGSPSESNAASVRKSPKLLVTPVATSSSQSFWEVLLRLDLMRLNRKGKGVQRMSTSVGAAGQLTAGDESCSSVENSPMGQLMTLLSGPVIRRSPMLTDRLLKLLSNISTAISSESGVKTPVPNPVRPGGSTWWELSETSATQSKQVVDKETVLLSDQLKLAVQVLTSKSCSEEGLEDSTRLLLRLSNANQPTKRSIVKLLLSGAQEIGQTVCTHIESLLNEAKEHNRQLALAGDNSTGDLQSLEAAASESRPSTSTGSGSARGLIPDRYQEGAMVMIAPPKNKSRSHDLQLPSMQLLTAKSSSQHFLLRLLKVVIQLSNNKSAAASSSDAATASTDTAAAASENAAAPVATVTATQESGGDSVPETATTSEEAASGDAAAGPNDNSTAAQPSTMDVDEATPSTSGTAASEEEKPLCDQLQLDVLWDTLGECLTQLSQNNDQNAVLILQPAVETFFLVHAGQRENVSAKTRRERSRREDQLSHLNLDEPPASPAANTSDSGSKTDDDVSLQTKKFLKFAETHRTVLNQILRQSQTPLSDGPFSVLVEHMKLLDFDVKNRYFKAELQKLDQGMRREDVAVHVKRDLVFEDSYRELFRRTPEEWKHRLYIVFEGEEGQDAGGLLREWYLIMSREIFNPNYALFMTTPQDRVTYTINPLSYYNSEHLSYFRFVGRIIAKAIYDNKLLECYFTRSFYKHITGQPVRYTDMEAEDYSFYQGLEFLLTHDIKDLGYDLTFSTEIQELGVTQTRELKPNGANIPVTEDNKKEYVKLVCQLKMTGAIRKQLNAFLQGFYDIIPKYLISIFNEQELELLISGLPTVDVDDLKANTEYHKYNTNSLQIVWFWRALRSFDQAERARFLQFVTGTSKVPLQGFAYLEGMNGTQKFQIHRDDRSTDRLPCAHTCFNQLDLPAYETYDKLKRMLLLVISECSEGFGLA